METIRVNMTPCEDVQTIHASQNDNEAREWGFELHNNGEKIDSSSISDQLVFKAYEGGTEEILPTNGSTPTTSPFKGNIKYPQGLLSDQEFLYRESPTEEDGLAKITDIKGNTLVWNQLVQNGNFADGLTNWAQANATLSVSNGVCRATLTGGAWNNDIRQTMTIVNGHKYLLSFDYLTSTDLRELTFTTYGNITAIDFRFSSSTTKKHHSAIYTATADYTGIVRFTMRSDGSSMSGQYYEVSNVNLFDLTQMGLDSLTVDEFTSLFPKPYYAYNQGTLLSFMGNGIKTVGFNQWDGETESGYIYNGILYASNDYWRTKNYIPVIPNETYYFNVPSINGQIALYDANKSYVSSVNSMGGSSHLITIPNGCHFARFYQPASSDSSTVCVNISGDKNGTYEPYTSSTLSLPISTYFPNGMKSAGSVYDELTESKAISRIGALDLGSITWTRWTSGNNAVFLSYFTTGIKVTQTSIPKCAKYEGVSVAVDNISAFDKGNKTICYRYPTFDRIYIRDDSFTNEAELKASLNGVYLYYELATENETSFSTASLVTENAEIPLSNEDGALIGKCTEQLSAEPGFHDAKIKLSDADGTCYSNKLQLHVERKP